MKGLQRIASAIVLTLTLLGLYAFWWEPSSIRVVEHEVASSDGGPLLASPIRVAVIADLHAGSPYIDETKMDRIVALTMAHEPDLILLAGDYVIHGVVGGDHIPIEAIAKKLSTLSAPLGVFAVIGNHDRWENAPRIARVLEASGIRVLEDQSAEVPHNGTSLHLIGLADFFTVTPRVQAALAGVPDGARALCFTHSPDVFPQLPGTCALTITGHTHGGQVWFPVVGRMIVPSQYGQRYAAGIVRENGKVLFVSTGIGTSIIPVRFGVVPEISILNVK